MQRVIDRFIVVASVVAVAAGSAACGRQDGSDRASSILGPTALEARGGGGKPGGGGTTGGGSGSSLNYVMVIDKNGDRVPSFGDTVTFTVQTGATAYPYVTLRCKQNGTQVYQGSRGIFATSLEQDFTLVSTLWTSGAADCTATLENWDSYSKNGSITALASTSFSVN